MFKIAYGAGHNDKTANGIPEYLHKPRMNEWRLNDRVARYFEEAARQYQNVELLRVDDPAGQAGVSLIGRCKTANNWKADFFLSIHHNAGIHGGNGGGLVAFSNPGSTQGAAYRDAIYEACMAAGGIKGDRWDATLEHGYYVLQYTNMPAVLMEYGFMDSATDVPVILTEEYAKAMAYATMAGIAEVAGLQLKPEHDPAQQQFYRVQVGAFNVRSNADAMLKQLQEQGYEAFIVTVPIMVKAAPAQQQFYRVQVGAFNERGNAEALLKQLQEQGYEAFIVTVLVIEDEPSGTPVPTEEARTEVGEPEAGAVPEKVASKKASSTRKAAEAEPEAETGDPSPTNEDVSSSDTGEKGGVLND